MTNDDSRAKPDAKLLADRLAETRAKLEKARAEARLQMAGVDITTDKPLGVEGPTATETDFFKGDVEGGLEKMRRRLLDLTKRNRLLNYRYSNKGALRVVDELPDQLYQQLVDGKELFFKPVPRPAGSREAVAGTESLPGFQQLSAVQQAEHPGIQVSFDLPLPDSGRDVAARHADRAIQTVHYPEDLEAILRSLASAARLTIEETGTNMLYLAFGFLDWYGRDDSEQAATAPLILLPVSLRRVDADSRTRAYRYAIKYSDEDILANISLQELLRQDFALALPDFDEDETPESYFTLLKPILRSQPKWKVRRHITLTLLSFGKLLMYRDLDPKNWPSGRGPANHSRVREFFEGRRQNDVEFAEDYSLDDPPLQSRVPALVDEADSSQHSALVDAMAGRNLVIAGPPGTGKSQTITNLVAAAMSAGKRVLFVSEKLAALEVVRHRLERLGLGSFCLELHSHKSNKRALLDDIDARMQQQRSFVEPAALRDKLKALNDTKQQLSEYAELINRPFGPLHQKLFDVLWKAARGRSGLGATARILTGRRIDGVGSLTLDGLDVLTRAVDQYAKHFESASPSEGLAANPWYGVRSPALTFRDEERVLESLGAACSATQNLSQAHSELDGLVGEGSTWLEPSIRALSRATEMVFALPSTLGIVAALLPKLGNAGAFRRIAEFIGWLDRWQVLGDEMENSFGRLPMYDTTAIRQIREHLDEVAVLAPAVSVLADLQSTGELAARASNEVRDGCAVVDELRQLVGAATNADDECAPALTAFLQGLADCPIDTLHLRHTGLTGSNAVEVLRRAAEQSALARGRVERLSARIDLALAPDRSEVRSHIVALTNVRWWSFLRSEFRHARQVHLAISKTGKVSVAQMHGDFRELLDVHREREESERNADFRAVSGSHFAGIETPFEALGALALWRQQSRNRLLPLRGGEQLADMLWAAPAELLSAFASTEGWDKPRKMRFENAISYLEQARMALGNSDLLAGAWAQLVTRLDNTAGRLGKVNDYVRDVALPLGVKIEKRADLEAALLERVALQARIDGATDVAQLLGDEFDGTTTPASRLRSTIDYWKSVSQLDLPADLRNHLLSADASERLERLRQSLVEANRHRVTVDQTWDDLSELVGLNSTEWHGQQELFEDRDINGLIGRCQRALENSRLLADWLDYLHAADDLRQRDLGFLVELAESNQLQAIALKQAFEFVHANSLVEEVFQAHPQLARFSGLSHEQVRRRYAELDKECITLQRRYAAAATARRPVPRGVGYGAAADFTEQSLLEREIGKQKRHIPLRQLMKRAGNAVQALKPCFMMGPLSVAQYLSPGVVGFDLLIVDEASQLRPQDALGAIARANQIVIVGDQKQLPPTSFFDRLGDEEDDQDVETSAIEDSESILDVASSLYRPGRMLKWHYRSRHGSLIAFSNKEFYNNDLVVFPSPEPRNRTLGVKFVHVADGVFDNRRNRVEALRIVNSALRHMEQRTSETLGIVAMNAPQRELIEELLEQKLKLHPAAERFVQDSGKGLEPVFVKNLENVQGDERDVIYISATYGRNADGHFHQRFGPILGATGHRRLNVLFTRARKRVVLFSSMQSADIRIQPGSAWGLRALKGYLQYAETGILETASFTGREPDSDFELEVAAGLKDHGLEVVTQVGVAGYYLDLAVKHPDKADAFILGIECDGATYHSSLSARDRDRLRQSVLEDLGWKIHRVWSTDWFKQRDREIERILERVQKLRQQPAVETTVEEWIDDSRPSIQAAAAEDAEWIDEVQSQPLTEQEAREQLLLLRDVLSASDKSIAEEDSILRAEMIAELIKAKPRTREDWQRSVPFDARLDTNGDHVTRYLARVMEITCRLR